MSEPFNDIEHRLTQTLQSVAIQIEAAPGGLERLRAAQADGIRPTARSHPRYWRLSATAAAAAIIVGGGIWVAGAVSRSNQATSAGANTPDRLRVANLVPATGPLYLLPPDGTDLSGEVAYTDEPVVDTGSGLVVGQLTDTGFDNVVLIAHLTSGPSFDEFGSVTEIAGRTLRQPDHSGADGTWTAAEELTDGTWIEYTTVAGADVLAEAVAGTTIVEGQLELAETGGLEELGRMSDLQGLHLTWLMFSTGDEAAPASLLIRTSTYDPELGLAFAGIYGPAEQTTLQGRPAYLIQPRLDEGPTSLVLTWATSSGHVIELYGQMSEYELREFAAQLRIVDRQTWEAELSPHADTGS